MRYRISDIGFSRLNEEDRLQLIQLLSKVGYATRQGRFKPNPKSAAYKYYI